MVVYALESRDIPALRGRGLVLEAAYLRAVGLLGFGCRVWDRGAGS